MLQEEQVAELLRRCEAIAGRELKHIRGNLRKAPTRAEAVWELLVAEAAAQLGPMAYESTQGGPDIRLKLPTGRWASIEVTYLHPRFDSDEQRSAMVARWMHDAAALLGPNRPEIRCQFHGDKEHPAGPRRTLPREDGKKRFLESTEVAQFLDAIAARPTETHQQRLKDFSVTLMASPRVPGSHGYLSWEGPLQEAPKVVNQHAAFRAIRRKLEQHKLDEPHLVCIGSDVSPALSFTMPRFGIRLENALGAAVRNSGELSGIIIVNIRQATSLWQGISCAARSTVHPVKDCRHPLTEEEWLFIHKLDLNRWKYTFPLPRREVPAQHRQRHVSGSLEYSSTMGGRMKLAIPAFVLVDVLAGRTQLPDQYSLAGDHSGQSVMKHLKEGWSVVACSFRDGDVQQAKAASVVLELAPPHDPVFWPRA